MSTFGGVNNCVFYS